MTALQWMDIIYPANVALFVAYLIVKAAYMFIVRRSVVLVSTRMARMIQVVIVLDWLLALTEAIVVAMLARMTGESPAWDIVQYRVYVAWVRGLMGVVLAGCITAHAWAIWVFLHTRVLAQGDRHEH